MASYSIKAQLREKVGKQTKTLRKGGQIPAVLYGHGIKNKNLTVDAKEFEKLFSQVSYSHLLDLITGEAKPVKVLIHDVQKDPVKDKVIHVDFYQIKEGEKITTEIPLVFINDAPAVKELGAILVTNYHNIEIKCLPEILEKIGKVEIDLSSLKNFSDSIHIKDLKLPKELEVLESPDEIIVIATEPKEEKIEEVPAAVSEIKTVAEEEAAKEEIKEGVIPAAKEGAPVAPKIEKEKAK
ncbi:50S ribosomal protein L25 [Candidatus Falkowbacteria bacterium]|nr:50S ribosomal protein L25 [Candidatus Falkowbacteria bacterium]